MKSYKKPSVTNPTVSWIICSNIDGPMVRQALESCLNQTYTDFEIIFLCNGENGKELAENLSRGYSSESRLGVYFSDIKFLTHNLNLGLELCRGRFVARMDSDDISLPNRLECQVEFMEKNPKVTILGSYYKVINIRGEVLKYVRVPAKNHEIRKALTWRNPLCHPSVMYRKVEIAKLGGYMGGLQAEDYDLWVKAAESKDVIFENLTDYLLLYRDTSSNNTRRSVQAYASVAGTQFQRFVKTLNVKYLVGAVLTLAKRIIR